MIDSAVVNYVSLIVNGVFAAINIIVAIFLLGETRKMREAETEPELSIYLDRNIIHPGQYDLVIKNIGKGAAYSISFEFNHEAELVKKTRNAIGGLPELGIMQGVPYFAPGQEYRTLFGGNVEFGFPPYQPLIISSIYSNKNKKKIKGLFIIDPMIFWHASLFHDEDKKVVKDSLKTIASRLDIIAKNLGK